MSATYSASRRVASDSPEEVTAAVRAAIEELRETLQRHSIEATFDDIALLGHSESWDGEGQRWVQVDWDSEKTG
ncbi:hypothetical protein [Pseudarthrobacter sp. S9]|uniref:hypothetical protein n=1 Tax=Pseudarthrobacter sp. S9 TaxID=3418421 RepID=UPI003CFCFBA8